MALSNAGLSRVISEAYHLYDYENPGLRAKEIVAKDFAEAASLLFSRLEIMQGQLLNLKREDWEKSFITKCQKLLQERQQEWLDGWRFKCSGKQFFKDLYVKCGIGTAPITFKRRLLTQCKLNGAEGWKLLHGIFTELIERNSDAA